MTDDEFAERVARQQNELNSDIRRCAGCNAVIRSSSSEERVLCARCDRKHVEVQCLF